MTDAIKKLFEEHDHIVNVADAIRQAGNMIGSRDEEYAKLSKDCIRFFRLYADRYHHHKEEEILFPEMCKKSEMLEDGVIHEMLENHSDFRDMLSDIEKKIDAGELTAAHAKMMDYTGALLDHIAAENDEVFQMAETLLDDRELENMNFRFDDCDRDLGDKEKREFEEWAAALRARMTVGD